MVTCMNPQESFGLPFINDIEIGMFKMNTGIKLL